MKKVFITVNNKRFEVELLQRSASSLTFTCNGEAFHTTVDPSFTPTLTSTQTAYASAPAANLAPSAPLQNGNTSEITAPMPGIVVSIPVKKGAKVASGDTIAVIEAMKMENNIKSSRNGIIDEILVAAGSEVSTGQVLVKFA